MPDFSKFTPACNHASETATRNPALALLHQASLLPSPPLNSLVLDNACSSGPLTGALLGSLKVAPGEDAPGGLKVISGDLEPKMVEYAEERIRKNGWEKVAEAKVIDAQAPTYPEGHFSHILMNFGPQLMSDPVLALKETFRILKPNGVAGFTCWSKPGFLPSVREFMPDFPTPPTPSPWTQQNYIESTVASVGFTDIKITPYDFETTEENLDAYLELTTVLMPLLSGETGEKYGKFMKEKYGKEPVKMEWQALIVTAKKTLE